MIRSHYSSIMKLFMMNRFYDWFLLEFVFIYYISLMYKHLLELIKRRSKVQENNISCERALNFDQ